MKERIKQKLKDLRDRSLHTFAKYAIRGIARCYGVKLPDVRSDAWLILRTQHYSVMFSPMKPPECNKMQMIGFEWPHVDPSRFN